MYLYTQLVNIHRLYFINCIHGKVNIDWYFLHFSTITRKLSASVPALLLLPKHINKLVLVALCTFIIIYLMDKTT